SNLRPRGPKPRALANCANPRKDTWDTPSGFPIAPVEINSTSPYGRTGAALPVSLHSYRKITEGIIAYNVQKCQFNPDIPEYAGRAAHGRLHRPAPITR